MIGNTKPRSSRRRLSAWLLGAAALAPLFSTTSADAQPNPYAPETPDDARTAPADVSGTVLSIDQEDIVLDLGSAKGAADGAVVEIWRPFKLRHPVTGRTLTDRFR